MATLATTVDGLKLANAFIIGSGPPGTNINVINKAFEDKAAAEAKKMVRPTATGAGTSS
jgi:hypothetical protein